MLNVAYVLTADNCDEQSMWDEVLHTKECHI